MLRQYVLIMLMEIVVMMARAANCTEAAQHNKWQKCLHSGYDMETNEKTGCVERRTKVRITSESQAKTSSLVCS